MPRLDSPLGPLEGGQETLLKPRQAAHYSVAFTVGLFITIALIGIICALLGRMLGDVGNYWQVLAGLDLDHLDPDAPIAPLSGGRHQPRPRGGDGPAPGAGLVVVRAHACTRGGGAMTPARPQGRVDSGSIR